MKKTTGKEPAMLLSAMALAACLLAACGAAGGQKMAGPVSDTAGAVSASPAAAPQENGIAYESAYIDAGAGMEMAAADADTQGSRTQDIDGLTFLEEKLVYRCSLDIETLDYRGTMTAIKDTVARYNGIIQTESESDSGHDWYYADYRKTGGTMHNYLEVRIPSADYGKFLAELDGTGKIISKSTSVDNISQKYYDTAAQVEALQIQEKNLLAMMEKCETIEDMIAVEERLAQVQYELDSLQTTRRYMDMDVAYSYVDISVSEVMEYRQDSAPVRRNTFMDRLKNTVKYTGKDFLAFLEELLFLTIRMLPYIIMAVLLCFLFLRKKIRRLAETHAKRQQRKKAVIQQTQKEPDGASDKGNAD